MSKGLSIEYLLEFSQADAILVLANNGKLIDSLNLKQRDIVAESSKGMFEIAERFSRSITNGSVQQLVIRSDEGIYIAHKMIDGSIVVVFSKDISKYGMIALAMDRMSSKRNVF